MVAGIVVVAGIARGSRKLLRRTNAQFCQLVFGPALLLTCPGRVREPTLSATAKTIASDSNALLAE